MAFTRQDIKVDAPVRWCPGCGDFAILAAVQQALPECGIRLDDIVFVSGIGCSSRFPYYMNTYGFHGIHGRGAAIATGIKLANPGLSVWHTTGDGDSMAIGGNHFIHAIRRNIDLNILLFNNKIYALTKGQYSPTTPQGYKTKTSPEGVIEKPFQPGELTMSAGGTFYARVIDNNPKLMKEVFIEAAKHPGTSVVEILQNCVIFADNIHQDVTEKKNNEEHTLYLRHDEPMLFGLQKQKGLRLLNGQPEVVTLGENGITMNDILRHDAGPSGLHLHLALARMKPPQLPYALGIFRNIEAPTFDQQLSQQVENAKESSPVKNLHDLLNSGQVFELHDGKK